MAAKAIRGRRKTPKQVIFSSGFSFQLHSLRIPLSRSVGSILDLGFLETKAGTDSIFYSIETHLFLQAKIYEDTLLPISFSLFTHIYESTMSQMEEYASFPVCSTHFPGKVGILSTFNSAARDKCRACFMGRFMPIYLESTGFKLDFLFSAGRCGSETEFINKFNRFYFIECN